jgi:hypothetical protein
MNMTATKPQHDEVHEASGSTQVNTRLPVFLNERLERYCKRYNVSKAGVMKEGLVRELDRRERVK